ncbi:MAG: T9SS type A sorting domain-containing protein [Bacteroidota bacterium]
MKSLFLSLLLLSLLSVSYGQSNVARKKVVVEIATGTWCYVCPGAAMGADDLHQNGHDATIIKNHRSDAFSNAGSTSRNQFYSVSGYPTAYFDGQNPLVGGSQTNSLYGHYLNRYNNAIAVNTPIDFEADLVNTSGNNYQIQVRVDQVGTIPGNPNLVLHLVLTESHLAANWFSMTECNFVNRLMMPNQNGSPLNLSVGTSDTIDHTFTVPNNYVILNSELVIFVQDMSSGVIYQGDNRALFPSLPLPLMVEDFTANMVGSECQLSWHTFDDATDAYFVVEHSFNGKDFLPLGQMRGEAQGEYEFLHKEVMIGRNYYRLLQMDPSGERFYSNVVEAELDLETNLSSQIYPNPSSDGWVSLMYYAEEVGTLKVDIFDIQGKWIAEKIILISPQQTHYRLDVSDLPAGNFILHAGADWHRLMIR